MDGTNNNGVFAMTNGTVFIYEMVQINATGRKQTPIPLPAGKENQCRVVKLTRAETLDSDLVHYSSPTVDSWCGVEAPEFWVDKRGYYHTVWEINHKPNADPPGPGVPQRLPGNTTTAGGHMFSTNGIHWHVSQTVAWTADVRFEDGQTLSFARREDPKFVRDACGEPVALMTPAMLSIHSDHSYVLAQPIAHNKCTL
jgi:hypothetical protein